MVPSYDPIILEFLQGNLITLTMVFGVLTAIFKTFKLDKLASLVDSIKGVFFSTKLGKGVVKNVVKDEGKEESEKLPEV